MPDRLTPPPTPPPHRRSRQGRGFLSSEDTMSSEHARPHPTPFSSLWEIEQREGFSYDDKCSLESMILFRLAWQVSESQWNEAVESAVKSFKEIKARNS